MPLRGYSSTVASERVLVSSRTVTERADWQRVDASTFDTAMAALDRIDDVAGVCAVLAATAASEELIALVSMLVLQGVRTFETSDPQTVKRILDTQAAIVAGDIEVLGQ